jgi:hypothetical protein
MSGPLVVLRGRVVITVTVATLALILASTADDVAAQDLWDQTVTKSTPQSQFQLYEGTGQSGLNYRGGAGLPLSAPSGGGGTVGSISGNTGKGCGIDFAAEFKALFDVNALESYFKGLASSAISSAPLVLMCYVSPTLCDAYKHFKSMASGLLQARAAECQAVESAALDYGSRMAKKREIQCIEEKTAAGTARYIAQDECRGIGTTELVGFDFGKVSDINIVDDGLKQVGADEDTQRFAKTILGDVGFRGSSSSRRQEFKKLQPDGLEQEWGRLYQEYGAQLTTLVEQVKGGGTPAVEELQRVSAPGIPITRSLLQQLSLMQPSARALAIQRVASALTLARLEYQLHVLQMELSELSRLAANTNQSTEEVERQIRTLEAMRGRLRALKEGQDNLTQVLREMDQAASAERAAARGRATITPPKEPTVDLGGGLLLNR